MRLPRSMHWRIAAAYTALILISMGAVSIYLIDFISDSYVGTLESSLEDEARLVGEAADVYLGDEVDVENLQAISDRVGDLLDARVTLIGLDGGVLSDNWADPRAMENHSARPEVVGAFATGVGKDSRVSQAIRQELLHIAVPIVIGGEVRGVARVAVRTSEVQATIDRIVATVALSGLVVTTLSIALGYYLARRTSRSIKSVAQGARRLAEGDLEQRVHALAEDETQELADAFNNMASSLKEKILELSSERNKLSLVLESMADGVVVINEEGEVELINLAARTILGVDPTAGQDRFMELVRDHEMQKLVDSAAESRRPEAGEIERRHLRQYLSVLAIPLAEDRPKTGVLLTIHDLSRIRQVETTRKEFVSNVSHELRTPLASVKAAVETLEDGALAKPEVSRRFVGRIRSDVERMILMVSDLLELSKLESGHAGLSLHPIELRPLLEEVKAMYQDMVDSKDIEVRVSLPYYFPPPTKACQGSWGTQRS